MEQGHVVFVSDVNRLSKFEHPYFIVVDNSTKQLVHSCNSHEEAVEYAKQVRREGPEFARHLQLAYYRPPVQNFFSGRNPLT